LPPLTLLTTAKLENKAMAKPEPKTNVPCPQCGRSREVGLYYAHRRRFSEAVCRGCRDRNKVGHGQTGTRAYHAWENMRSRCLNPNFPQFHHYGGRGITICDRWSSFENFLTDMGEPAAGMSLDRIENDAGYGPDNCRWATQAAQMRNTRANRLITAYGVTKKLVEWAEDLGTESYNILKRIGRGWSVEDAVTVPVGRSKHGRSDGSGVGMAP
jgi:hypothetical protein